MRKALARIVFALAILMACFLVAGCAGQAVNAPGASSQQAAAQESPRTVAYKSLATMNKTYNATMKSLADLYRQKLIDEQVKGKAIEYCTAFQRAYNKAVDAAESDDFSSISGVSVALADLLDFVQPYLIKGGKTIMGAAELGIAITELALKYGVPLAIDLASTWRQNLSDREPTKEDFEALRLADSATFFDAEGPGT